MRLTDTYTIRTGVWTGWGGGCGICHEEHFWDSQVALVVKNPSAKAGDTKRCGFYCWVRKIPWRRAWQPTLVFLPGESPWAEEPGGLQSIGLQRVGHN